MAAGRVGAEEIGKHTKARPNGTMESLSKYLICSITSCVG